MNNTVKEELMDLITQTLNEQQNCCSIQQLIEKFPTTSELLEQSNILSGLKAWKY
ncbi:hypothetical protein [Paenibacillus sp. FSL R5-0470]|uniref:hypothetical protein n=1 Tax=Paenibacillus sp. FSL R5-0470 TaxID=2921641 RepID=UPI0030D99966